MAVGGTTLNSTTPPPAQVGWSGSGGGQSSLVARPAYQSGLAISRTKRLVPDIAVDANTGAAIYDSQPDTTSGFTGGDLQVGGTSLAAPISAGALASSLTSIGCTTGFGDIHPAIYTSANVTHVTTGTNDNNRTIAFPGGGFTAGRGTTRSPASARRRGA